MTELTRSLPSWGGSQMFAPDDRFIAVMGITGSGKSSFISLLTGDDDVKIGHNLVSCTAEVRPYSFIHRDGRRVFILDTPGFDDTKRSDTDILKDVAYYLTQTYKQKIYLNGIIYLHRITDHRMQGSALKNLNMFKALCGEDVYQRVVLTTTMWDNLWEFKTGTDREAELLGNPAWWGLMHDRGSKVARHNGSQESASAIVDYLLRGSADVVLNIQKELVDYGRDLDTTEAGKAVEQELLAERKKFQTEKKELEEQHAQALLDRDFALADTLKQQREEYDRKLQTAMQAQADLRINLERLEQEKREEIRKLEASALKQASDLLRIQSEAEGQLELLREKAQKEKKDLSAELEKMKADAKKASKNDADKIKMMEQKLFQQDQDLKRQEAALAAKIESAKTDKSVLLKVLLPFMSLGVMVLGLVTGDGGSVMSGLSGIFPSSTS